MLAAAAAVAALAGAGVAVWIATGSDDEPPRRASSVASAPETTGSAPSATATTEDTPAESTETAPEEPQPPQESTETVPTGGAQKTHFPRERRKPKNDPPPREFSVPPAREFSGTGNATLGTVNLSRPALVKWSTKGPFELRFGREAFPIVAPSASGELVVPPYSFERVRVIASGRWKISITPQK
jgi:hypothetical protein